MALAIKEGVGMRGRANRRKPLILSALPAGTTMGATLPRTRPALPGTRRASPMSLLHRAWRLLPPSFRREAEQNRRN